MLGWWLGKVVNGVKKSTVVGPDGDLPGSRGWIGPGCDITSTGEEIGTGLV